MRYRQTRRHNRERKASLHRQIRRGKIIAGLLVAGLVGAIARKNASISGAEVGCQGEIGVASAMGAALLAHVYTGEIGIIERAAEIALEHHLSLSCDPVGGHVQIPCIERNAIGAVTAFNAFLLAQRDGAANGVVSLDATLAAMMQTGKSMKKAFKETSLGGLAAVLKNHTV